MQRRETGKIRDIIHYFLMHTVLHSYIMACTLAEGWPGFRELAAEEGGGGALWHTVRREVQAF